MKGRSYSQYKVIYAGIRDHKRPLLLILAAFVVFVMTYLLILPAMTLDEQEAAEQGGIDVPGAAEIKAEEPEPAMTCENEQYKVTVTGGENAGIPRDAEVRAAALPEDSEEYAGAYSALFGDEQEETIPMIALDISIFDKEGNIIEPTDTVTVDLVVKQLPENISEDELRENITISHLKETGDGVVVEDVAAPEDIKVEQSIEASFETDSFSVFTINWTYWWNNYHVDAQLIDTDGNSVGTGGSYTINGATTVANIAPNVSLHTFSKATIGGLNGTQIQRLRSDGQNLQYNTSANGGTWRDVGNNIISFVYEPLPPKIKVYVYVAAYDNSVTPRIEWKNSPEFLELLGISADTVDNNGYFPVGEIELDSSFFEGKDAGSKWQPLIHSQEDWEHVLAALGDLNTSTLVYDGGVDYSHNRGNSVQEYMAQAGADLDQGAGSQHTALFGWEGHSYGFEDQTVEYHLDLRFNTHKVTFITGKNGIRSGAARDGTTVDTRAYIVGSAIQEPRNMPIPAGYRFVGYYNDPDFTTPWNKIGAPLEQDEVAYIKITPQDNVILYYKPVPASGGTVSVDAEGVNPETGTPRGSKATPEPGYQFDGWYADEACTQLLSEDETYVPTKTSSQRWVDGTTYYAKFTEKPVTLTFVAEEYVDHLEFNDIPSDIISYEFSDDHKTLTVVVNAVSGSPVTVTGVAADGHAIKEWTIDGREGNLTTHDSITTDKADDPAATDGVWTERTYHVWAEVLREITVTKEVKIIGTLNEDELDTTVYFALKDMSKDPAPWVLNEDGSIYTVSISIVDGIPQGTAQFIDLPSGTYEVWEVADENAGNFGPGSVVAGTDIVVSRIQTWISDTDTSNDVQVTDASPDGAIKVINTFNHKDESLSFWAEKKWFTEPNSYLDPSAEPNVNVPDGAWVDFTLYRIHSDGQEEAVATIRLDGTADVFGEDQPWEAGFRDLANKDHDGNPVNYYVKETAVSPLDDYYTTFNDSTSTNGGSISNVLAYADLNIKKTIELPQGTSDADRDAFINALEITVTGPEEVDGSKKITRTLTAEDFNVSETTAPRTYGSSTQTVKVVTLQPKDTLNLPAGTYHVAESGYNGDALPYHWNAAYSWVKADKMPSAQSDIAGREQTGETETDVMVGFNTEDASNVELLNSYAVQDIKATKVWDDGEILGANHPMVRITLYREDGSGNKTTVSTQTIGANQTGDNLTLTWANQSQAYRYSVEEAQVPGYILDSITGDQYTGFIVKNKRSCKLKILKVDQTGEPLENAEFTLVGGSINERGLKSTKRTITVGGEEITEALIYENEGIPLGTFTLTETNAPAGYNSLEGPVTITVVQESGDIVITAEMNGKNINVERDFVTDTRTITIMNTAGVELPSTGGPGTTWIYLLGTILLLGCGITLIARRRVRRA